MNILSETEKAYLAGFYDGEGSFEINKRYHCVKDYRYIGYSMTSEVVSTNEQVLIYIKDLLGVGSISNKTQTGNRKPAWGFNLGAKDTKDLIKNIVKFSKIKSPIMEVCLSFPMKEDIPDKSERDRVRLSLHEKAKILNKRGLN